MSIIDAAHKWSSLPYDLVYTCITFKKTFVCTWRNISLDNCFIHLLVNGHYKCCVILCCFGEKTSFLVCLSIHLSILQIIIATLLELLNQILWNLVGYTSLNQKCFHIFTMVCGKEDIYLIFLLFLSCRLHWYHQVKCFVCTIPVIWLFLILWFTV